MAASTAYNFMGLSNGRSNPVSHGTNSSFSNSLNQAIDLTAAEDDDDEDMDEVDTSAVHERHFKRPRIDSSGYPQPPTTPYTPPLPPYAQTTVNQSARDRYRTQFVTNSSAFFPNRPLPGAPFPPIASNSLPNLHHPRPQLAQQPQKAKSRRGHVRQVIDLTSSPSPPPVTAHPPIIPPHMPPHMAIHHNMQQPVLHQTNLPAELEPRTPICIGQLIITALILYPTPYLHIRPKDPSQPLHPSVDFAPVRLRYDALARERSPPGVETIHIAIPPLKPEDGTEDRSYGENFGVVEQKVANIIGPMLGKGLIKVEAHVKRGPPNGNITLVSQHLHSASLLLDHPEPPFDLTRLNILYSNPHNPPPGGYGRSGAFARQCLNKWTVQTNSKTVEIQRNQVDEVFKSLKSGDELEETAAQFTDAEIQAWDINTTLYPHQKKALTFLLDRENEISGAARDPQSTKPQPIANRWQDGASSLWTARKDPSGRIISWMHAVTNREVFAEPKECKAALLADDMGLGKTITCVSLLAATLVAAREFGNEPLDPLPRIPLSHSISESSLSTMPHEGKSKGKGKIEEKREIEDYNRACRLKVKSRGTLIVCPLSTIVNWEDQFKEHWAGEVTVVGGACGGYTIGSKKEGTASIKVYVYHGNARNSDPNFLADFDAIITTFATLASEFSKQTRSADDDDASDGDGGLAEEVQNTTLDENGQVVLAAKKSKGKKRKKLGGTEQSSPLQMVHWFRVVLDEAQINISYVLSCIKETSTVGSRASCALTANRRLCLTGTPVQNKLDDVYALIKFLRLEPFDDKAIWTEYVGAPAKFGQPLGIARLQTLMKCITLRRTKETKAADGTNILNLPPRNESLEYLAFDEKEQRIYNDYFLESKEEFNQMSQKNEVMKNYVGILQKILRLRQICDHIELVKGKGVFADDDISDAPVNYEELVGEIMREGITVQRGSAIFNLLRESGTAQCVECGLELAPPLEDIKEEGLEDEVGGGKRSRKLKASQPTSRVPTRQSSPSIPRPVLTRCQHLFCMECFHSCIYPGWPNVQPDLQRSCSACQIELTAQDAVELSLDTLDVVKKKNATVSGGKREKRLKGQTSYMSTKIKALLQDLIECSKSNPHSDNYDPEAVDIQVMDTKGYIVREDVVKTVVLIEDALELARIKYDRLDGTMKRDERTRAMDALKYDPKCEVLLVSLKAGGVGLNLTAAQRVYLMDPYWNPAVENQAVDRIHRLGQTRPVTIKKFIIENSIEDRLLEVQKRKTALANMTLGQPLSKAELMHRRVEELNVLFGQHISQPSTQ
ncbi:hypothetical protein Clacol_004081 [Clathrus columnatus]|uniref:Uncharacterized protein n=1 Tax=Clathrus columnatus TaxID=1419009 RepID=A0AAV5A5J3_9AGAM|nr:hypothetical protein Clacol_004081 [Clathrus columnatus]